MTMAGMAGDLGIHLSICPLALERDGAWFLFAHGEMSEELSLLLCLGWQGYLSWWLG